MNRTFKMSESKKNAIVFIILFLIEIIIALFVHDEFIRPYIGDVLVVFLIYFFIKIFLRKEVFLLPLYIFAFAAIVETLQYFNIVGLLNLESNTFARIIIGSTFDIKDIICYFIGCISLFIYRNFTR